MKEVNSIEEPVARQLLPQVAFQLFLPCRVSQTILEKSTVDPLVALHASCVSANASVAELLLQHPRTKLTKEAVVKIKSHSDYVWNYFLRRLRDIGMTPPDFVTALQ